MNILILATHVNSGGITSYIWRLTRFLTKKGHRVYIVSGGGNMAGDIRAMGGEHHLLNIRTKSELSPKVYLGLPKLCGFIREKKIDIVHAQMRVTQVMGTFASKITGIPLVTTCHGFYKKRFGRVLFPCWGDAVIAISAAVEQHLITDFEVPGGKVHLIHHGVDLAHFEPLDENKKKEVRSKLGLKDEPVIGILARLSEEKGHRVLLAAMKKIIEKIPSALLLIIGTGRLEGKLKETAKRLGLQKNVRFYPVVNQIMSALGMFDISVLPSFKEGLGFAVLEAQSMAVPVVASRTGGIIDTIENGKTGILVEPGNSDELAKAIISLLEDKQKAKEMALAGRTSVQEKFSVHRMIDETEALYQYLVTQKTKSKNKSHEERS